MILFFSCGPFWFNLVRCLSASLFAQEGRRQLLDPTRKTNKNMRNKNDSVNHFHSALSPIQISRFIQIWLSSSKLFEFKSMKKETFLDFIKTYEGI